MKRSVRLSLSCAASASLAVATLASPLLATPKRVAVLGDSLSTGAATHPALIYDGTALWKVFSGEAPTPARRADLPPDPGFPLPASLAAPTRLWPSSREFFGGPDWVYRNTLQILSRAYLDTEEYSWGYLAAVGAGVAPDQVMLAGEDGARVVNMPRHLDRVLDATGGELPEEVLVMYTGNDLCGLALSDVTSAADFEAGLDAGFAYLLRNGRAPAGGADVRLLSYLGILQLLHGEAILAKAVHAFGGETTCKELRAHGFRPASDGADKSAAVSPEVPWFFALFMPPNPAAFCPTLFGEVGEKPEETIGTLANRIRDFRAAEARAVATANKTAKARGVDVRFHHVTTTAELVFDAADIAGDCFHLSAAGQAKVARALIESRTVAETPKSGG